jgi:hypothetical protein
MASESLSTFVSRLRGQQRSAVPGGSRRDFFGDRVVTELARSTPSCPRCESAVSDYTTSCRECGELLIRASA